jgi:hypothetical protein
MKVSKRLAVSVAAAFGLTIAATNLFAHPGGQGGMGQGGMQRLGHGMMGGGHGMMGTGAPRADANQAGCQGVGPRGGMRHGGTAHDSKPGERGPMGGQSLFTPDEQRTMRDTMRNAATADERQQIVQSHRDEMQKRALAKGITLPEGFAPRGGFGPNTAPANRAPAETF